MGPRHLEGHTTGTGARPAQDFTQDVHQHTHLDLEGTRLLTEASSKRSHRATKTFSKNPSMSVEVVAIIGGTTQKQHATHGAVLLQTLRGHLRVKLPDATIELGKGQILTLASHVPHTWHATEDTVLLLVVAADGREPETLDG